MRTGFVETASMGDDALGQRLVVGRGLGTNTGWGSRVLSSSSPALSAPLGGATRHAPCTTLYMTA